MLAPSPTPAEQPTSLVTEAEVIANLLLDMDVPLTARLDSPDLLFQVSRSTPSGAVDLMKIAIDRFEEDDGFREDMIAHLGTIGDYVAGAPGINADLKAESVDRCFVELAASGFVVETVERPGGTQLRFAMIRDPKPNATLLIKLITDRFDAEPKFAAHLKNLCA